MNKAPETTDEWRDLKAALRRLLIMLEDPHPGLFTWWEMFGRARDDVLRELQD